MIKKRINVPGILFISLFFICILVFFSIFYEYHIFFIEQLQVFLLTFSHFVGYLHKPAFLSSYLGDFLTQFYYLIGGGAVVITVTLIMLWLSAGLLFKKLSKKSLPFLLPLIPVAFSWIALCDLSFPVSNVIAIIISVLCTLIYISINSGKSRIIFGIIMTGLLYIATGSSFYILTVTAICYELFRSGNLSFKPQIIIYLVIMLCAPILFSLGLRGTYLLTSKQALTYLSDLTKNAGYIQFLPLILLIVTVLAAFLPIKRITRRINSSLLLAFQLIILASVLIPGILHVADFTMEKILRLDYEANHNRWDKVYDLSRKYGMHNNLSAYYTNIALSKFGVMPDELMEHYQPATAGLFLPVNANQNYLTIVLSNEVYWQLGDLNASQHSAMLGTIFSPRAQNSRLMKRLVEINIVNGQYDVAGKFITILEKTMFHKKWASDRRKYLFNEAECAGSKWITEKRAIIPVRDLLKKGNDYLTTLRMLADNHSENRMAIDYLLCYHLLAKDIRSFAEDFNKYYSAGNMLLPKIYQEALLIWITSGAGNYKDYEKFGFSPVIMKDMAEYTKIFEENEGKGYALQQKYGKTYWFYYHFATMKTK